MTEKVEDYERQVAICLEHQQEYEHKDMLKSKQINELKAIIKLAQDGQQEENEKRLKDSHKREVDELTTRLDEVTMEKD